MRILVSWIAFNNDFKDGKAIKEGPTFKFHEHFYRHDKHIVFYASAKEETRMDHLINLLERNFKDRAIERLCLNVTDPINVNEIKTKVETQLLKLSKSNEIDVFISPGTPAMQVSWYLLSLNPALKLNLCQTRSEQFTKTGKPELIKIKLDESSTPTSAVLLQEGIDELETDYLITDAIKPIYANAKKIAQTDNVTTLILGESGTGKEHLASYIHNNSIRKTQPYLTLNCSALNDQLLESRLFGYKKGSFTGADKDTPGLLEEANGGTVFLDEIGDISPYMQQSLLRVLQSGEIQPVGGKPKKVNVRIVAATNKDLPKMCDEGKFRWDLYYRLSVVELMLPTLAKRGKKDVKEMIDFFLKTKKTALAKDKKLQISRGAMDVLLNYSYPGNIRELENLIARLYVFNTDTLNEKDLPERLTQEPVEQPLNWAHVEKQHIKKVLTLKEGNQRQTALALGWALNTLKKKMKEYNL
jgi:transcriptional regulator of acetoin/glycerol metabolism